MKYNFCTLFDKNYLIRGLALHDSLLHYCQNFHLWILCMDDTAYEILSKLKLDKVTLIKLSDFEDKELLKIKSTRAPEEYCWTCTPSLLLYVLKHFPEVKIISYLDADLYFFSSPEPIFEEMGNMSIMIIPHCFASNAKLKEKINGIFNVGMLSFHNDKNSSECLEWWRNKCLDWCYREPDNNKMGDQKYLDEFLNLFKNVHILSYVGAGVGPWNLKQYQVWKNKNRVYINHKPLIFFHFADLKVYKKFLFLLSSPLSNAGEISTSKTLIYEPYFKTLYKQAEKVQKSVPGFNYGFIPRLPLPLLIKEEILVRLIYIFKHVKTLISNL